MGKDKDFEDEEEALRGKGRTAIDRQRAKIERLMTNPEKPVNIPEPKKIKDPNKAPEFCYNVMGSSAGAGSGEFHVYRQIRRKELFRQNIIQGEKEKDELNEAYHIKLAENEKQAEERTAKKRNKRLKKKEAAKKRKLEQKKVSLHKFHSNSRRYLLVNFAFQKGKQTASDSNSSSSGDSESEEEETKDKK